jgi:hypothetical protein
MPCADQRRDFSLKSPDMVLIETATFTFARVDHGRNNSRDVGGCDVVVLKVHSWATGDYPGSDIPTHVLPDPAEHETNPEPAELTI